MNRRQAIVLIASGTASRPVLLRAAPAPATVCARFTLGCLFRVIIDDKGAAAQQAAGEALAIAGQINDACSEQMAGAQVQSFCKKQQGKPHEVGPGFFEALMETRRLAELTGGRFDPTIGPLTALWRDARRRRRLPDAAALAKARAAVGWQHLVLDPGGPTAMLAQPGMRLDFGAVARGFATDKMLANLTENGFPRALVRAGGDIRVGEAPRGAEAWRVRVPADESGDKVFVIPLTKGAVATTGGMRQAITIGGTRYAAIVDPATGLGLTRDIGATVVADTAIVAAALATAACIAGPEPTRESLAAWGGRAARIIHVHEGKRELIVTDGFPKPLT